MDDMQNARVIIVSWTIFAEEAYISELARFAAMPEPATTDRRAFDSWLDRVTDEIPGRLLALQAVDYDRSQYQRAAEDLLEERLQQEHWKATLPVRIQHGKAYQSYDSSRVASTGAKKKSTAKSQSKGKPISPSASTHIVPLLHLFRFDRLVVDEYHYLNDDKDSANALAAVHVKRIAAVKRWVLSGTPALANFSDVDQIASFLGIRLGRFYCGDGTMITPLEKARRAEQTLVEDFLAHTETMSHDWHRARHDRAQEFLDLFVRQNEPALQHIECSDQLLPVSLDGAHHAIYLELSQHLISQRMQIKKSKINSGADRNNRLTTSLNNSKTAEDALMKTALTFQALHDQVGIEGVVRTRSEQRSDTELEILELLAGFEGRKKDEEFYAAVDRFRKT
jgi:hypothetical protein